MNTVNRRELLRYSGVAAASFAVRNRLWALGEAPEGSAAKPIAKTEYGKISGTLEDGINADAVDRSESMRHIYHAGSATDSVARAAERELRAEPGIGGDAAGGNAAARGPGGG